MQKWQILWEWGENEWPQVRESWQCYSDCRNKDKCAFCKKPSGNSIRIRLLFRTVLLNLEDFRFRSTDQNWEIRRCCKRRSWVWKWCVGVTSKRQTKFGYLTCEKKKQSCQRVIHWAEQGNSDQWFYSVQVCQQRFALSEDGVTRL